jgi:hypothetical protein
VLEDWLFDMEKLFRQLRMDDDRERIEQAQLHMDRSMALWWKSCVEAAKEKGNPAASWAEFTADLREQFRTAGDAQAAQTELLHVHMTSAEAMGAYMQRVVLLVARAGAYVASNLASVLALNGVDKSRFPFAIQQMRAKVRAAGVAGISFAQMRGELTALALDEPVLPGRGGAGGNHTGGAPTNGSHRRHSNKSTTNTNSKQLRVNALKQQYQQQLRALQEAGDDEGDGDEGPLHTAPLGTGGRQGGSLKCYKCGKEGHVVAECTSKTELRKCYQCNQAGHVRSNCREKKQQREEGQASGQDASGKGQAPGSAPKNE